MSSSTVPITILTRSVRSKSTLIDEDDLAPILDPFYTIHHSPIDLLGDLIVGEAGEDHESTAMKIFKDIVNNIQTLSFGDQSVLLFGSIPDFQFAIRGVGSKVSSDGKANVSQANVGESKRYRRYREGGHCLGERATLMSACYETINRSVASRLSHVYATEKLRSGKIVCVPPRHAIHDLCCRPLQER